MLFLVTISGTLLFGLWHCGGELGEGASSGAQAPVSTVVDSAGVRIVQYDLPPLSQPTWHVDPTPLVLVGRSGQADEVLANPLSAIALPDGGLAVRDSQRGFFKIKFYNADGSLRATAAQWGEGPFEFEFPLGVHRRGEDSVLVVGEDGRYAVFNALGMPVREGPVQGLPVHNALWSYYMEEDLVVVATDVVSTDRTPTFGRRRSQLDYVVTRLSGDAQLDTLATFPSTPVWFREVTGRPGAVWTHRIPFSPLTSATANDGRFWLGRADIPEIRGYAASLRLEVLIRFGHDPESVSWWDRRAFKSKVAARGDESEGWSRYLREVEFPETKPYFGRLESAVDGSLWLQRYDPFGGQGAQYWDVFDRIGAWMATVAIPEALISDCERDLRRITPCDRIHDIGEDYVVIETEDSLGVRTVGKYRIRR